MMNPTIGQKCVKVVGAVPIWTPRNETEGEIIAVDETTVTANISGNTEQFNRKTNTSTKGIDHGWLELK